MQVKVFTGHDKDGIEKMEKEINLWFRDPLHKYEVLNTQTAMCTVADNGGGEQTQCMAITIWYDDEEGRGSNL
jgi:hypothetical protein